MSVSMVTRQHGVATSLFFLYHKQYQGGSMTALTAGEHVVPAYELASAIKQIKELQHLLGKKQWKMNLLKKLSSTTEKKVDSACALITQGWKISLMSRTLR